MTRPKRPTRESSILPMSLRPSKALSGNNLRTSTRSCSKRPWKQSLKTSSDSAIIVTMSRRLLAAAHHGLEVLATGVHDSGDAVTRFVLVRPPGPPSATPTGDDRTSIAATTVNRPGALLAAPHRDRHARGRPHPHRVAPAQGPPRRLLVLPRRQRARRRPRDGRGAGRAAAPVHRRAVPRLLPARPAGRAVRADAVAGPGEQGPGDAEGPAERGVLGGGAARRDGQA